MKNLWPWKKKPLESEQTTVTSENKPLATNHKQDSLHTEAKITNTANTNNAPNQQKLIQSNHNPALSSRIKQGLNRTRNHLIGGLVDLLKGTKEINKDLLEELETQLLLADVGVDARTTMIKKLHTKLQRKELGDSSIVMQALKHEMHSILESVSIPLQIDYNKKPYVVLVVGVNGVGKTTTVGKLAKHFQAQGASVLLAAGDTFRAAAVEQLSSWGQRNNVPVISQHARSDSASVIYDALESAKVKQVDVLIADTAGRLHNKSNLMEELKKIKRVMHKLDSSAPHEVLLVLDAGTGQNALNQARLFQEAAGVTGIALTKIDGTAKGGIMFGLSLKLKIPIRFLGVGEQIDDLRTFKSKEFIDALFDLNTTSFDLNKKPITTK